MKHGCDEPGRVVLKGIVDGPCNFGLGEVIECSVGSWKERTRRAVRKMEAWLVRFQRKAKTLLDFLCKGSVVLVGCS